MAYKFRRGVVIAVIAVILFFVGKISISIGRAVYLAYFPPVNLPTASFGKLPKLNIPSLALDSSSQPEYFLETTTGELPNLGESGTVHKIREKRATLLSEERMKNLAKSVGFLGSPNPLSASEYFWEDALTGRTLSTNIITESFTLDINPVILSQMVSKGSAPIAEQAISSTKGFLKSLDLLSEDFEMGSQTTLLVTVDRGKITEAISLSEAIATKVNFFKSLDDIPILGPNPKEGLIEVYITNTTGDEALMYPKMRYSNWEVEEDENATYYYLPINTAYEKITSGEGSIVYLKKDSTDHFESYKPIYVLNVVITDVGLIYYHSPNYLKYLQPVYVFRGRFTAFDGEEGEYIAYVPAVAEEWVE